MSLQHSKRNSESPSPNALYYDPRVHAAPTAQDEHGQRQIEIRVLESGTRKSPKERPIESQTEQRQQGRGQASCRVCSQSRVLWNRTRGLLEPSEASDVTVRASDGTIFHAHRFVIEMWAPGLLDENEVGREPGENALNVQGFPSEVVAASLRLMYGGSPNDVPLHLLSEMIKLASDFTISELQYACFETASNTELTPSNACYLWWLGRVCGLSGMQERAMRFVLVNLDAILKDDYGRAGWERTLRNTRMLLEMFYAICEWTTPKPEPDPERYTNADMDAIWNDSDGLHMTYGFPDVTLVTKEGEKLFVHLPLLTLTAPDFADYLDEQSGMSRDPVRIEDVDGGVMQEFLRCIYHQKPSNDFPMLADLVLMEAYEHNALPVIEACERQVAVNSLRSMRSAIEMLLEAEEHRMSGAKPVLFRYFFDQGSNLREDGYWKEKALENPNVIAEMILNWKSLRELNDE